MWSFKSTSHVKPGVGRIVSLKLVHKRMKGKMLTNEHIYETKGSYSVGSSSHLLLGDVDEIPCLLAGFSYLLANLLATIHTVLNGACLFGHLFSAFLTPLHISPSLGESTRIPELTFC